MCTPLQAALFDVIRQAGRITFRDYMALCLYHPEHGYYMRGQERTGVAGDYFTSADLHPVFARLIGRQAAEMWEQLGRPPTFTWVEQGAGRGLFACDFLAWAERQRPDFAAALQYVAIEPAAPARKRLRQPLARSGFEHRVRLEGTLADLTPLAGCFFSNELVDAFPVAVVVRDGGRLKEVYVTAEGKALRKTLGPISDPRIAAYVARYAKNLEEGAQAEVNLAALDWIQAVAAKLHRGFVLTIDYGDLAERLYTRDRPAGTLMAYRGHTPHEDVLSAPGEQDLTAHVNFSALIDAGRQAGLDFLGFTTQERFLMALGEPTQFADLCESTEGALGQLQARLKLKRLLYPPGMGGTFKVLIQGRGVSSPRLTGLKYAHGQGVAETAPCRT